MLKINHFLILSLAVAEAELARFSTPESSSLAVTSSQASEVVTAVPRCLLQLKQLREQQKQLL